MSDRCHWQLIQSLRKTQWYQWWQCWPFGNPCHDLILEIWQYWIFERVFLEEVLFPKFNSVWNENEKNCDERWPVNRTTRTIMTTMMAKRVTSTTTCYLTFTFKNKRTWIVQTKIALLSIESGCQCCLPEIYQVASTLKSFCLLWSSIASAIFRDEKTKGLRPNIYSLFTVQRHQKLKCKVSNQKCKLQRHLTENSWKLQKMCFDEKICMKSKRRNVGCWSLICLLKLGKLWFFSSSAPCSLAKPMTSSRPENSESTWSSFFATSSPIKLIWCHHLGDFAGWLSLPKSLSIPTPEQKQRNEIIKCKMRPTLESHCRSRC